MPYIKQEERGYLDGPITELLLNIDTSPGQLNYVITRLVVLWLKKIGGVNYFKIALVTGVLKNVSDELYRRVAAPYENSKSILHGDVFQEVLPEHQNPADRG